MIKYFSMFSGIGGFEKAIEQLGLEAECVGYSEINKYAISVYERHFQHRNFGDANKINTAELPDFDFLVGGFPCQAFSIAGLRKGFDDTRGTLFFEIARILKDKKPQYFLLENVKGLLSHDNGRTFSTIIRILTDLGYIVQWQVLNSKNFGVPQNRERVFIVGHFRGKGFRKVFPIGENDSVNAQQSREEQTGRSWVSTIDSRYGQRWSTETYVRGINYFQKDKCQSNRIYNTNGLSPTLAMVSGDCTPKIIMRDGRDNRSCLRSGRTPEIGVPGRSIRRLTPIECERLQGFPDNWTEGVSDTQRYKCLGNAVTVNVVEYLIRKIFDKKF